MKLRFATRLDHEDYLHQERQVMVFVTPHRWTPGMDTPMTGTNDWILSSEPDEER